SVLPTMTSDASRASGTPVALDTNGTVRLARGLASRMYTTGVSAVACPSGRSPLTANWMFISPRTFRAAASFPASSLLSSPPHARRGGAGGGVAPRVAGGVVPGPLVVLHPPADRRASSVRQAIDIDLGRVFEELVDQHRPVLGHVRRDPGHVRFQLGFGVDDPHVPPAEDEAWPHQQREADLAGRVQGLLHVHRRAVGRLAEPALPDELGEPLAA